MRSTPTLPLFPLQPAERHSGKPRSATARAARAFRPPVEPVPLSRAHCRQLWAAVHLPQLALEALEPSPQPSPASERGSGTSPVVVIDTGGRQQNVLACNEAALAAGVRPGQSLNAAVALAAQLEVLPRDETQERERLTRLATWCQQRFTPLVSLEPGNELLLEVQGSLRLFGGARRLMQCLAAGLREQNLTAYLALTPTPRSALWLARRGRGQGEGATVVVVIEKPATLARHLAPVALRCLRWPEELLAQFFSMGLRTVGDLVRLPRSGMARRLGPAWLEELDRALGRRADVRRRFRRPQRFDERRALDHEIETTVQLIAACRPLLSALQGFLRERQAAIAGLVLELRHRAHPNTRLRIGLAAPSGDVEHLRALLEERLAAAPLPAPVIAVRLHSGALLEQAPSPRPLPLQGGEGVHSVSSPCSSPSPCDVRGFGDDDALPRLLERLRARLGHETVFGVERIEDHRPEHAWRVIGAPSPRPSPTSGRGNGPSPQPSPASGTGNGFTFHRPLWLFAQPQWLSGKNPITRARAPLELLSGPERIETGWWDGHEVTRDYFVARDARGVRLWIYRERRPPHGWYVHGLFG